MFWIFCYNCLIEAILKNIQNMFLEVLNTMFLHNFWVNLSLLERRFCASLVIIIMNFIVVLSVGIKRVDCIVIFTAGPREVIFDFLDVMLPLLMWKIGFSCAVVPPVPMTTRTPFWSASLPWTSISRNITCGVTGQIWLSQGTTQVSL